MPDLHFNPLPPHGGRPVLKRLCIHRQRISIHSLRMEGDALPVQSLPPTIPYFNPLPPHGGRQITHVDHTVAVHISIHSLRMEGDRLNALDCVGDRISIHSLRMEGDAAGQAGTAGRGDFNPLPPHGGRLYHLHPLYANSLFQSTPSAWRETIIARNRRGAVVISIHSLRMEGDVREWTRRHSHDHFNPLPPHGGRQSIQTCIIRMIGNFNPLPPHGGRHAACISGTPSCVYFYPLPPHGGRHLRQHKA